LNVWGFLAIYFIYQVIITGFKTLHTCFHNFVSISHTYQIFQSEDFRVRLYVADYFRIGFTVFGYFFKLD